jgi:hypothetical protein
MSNRSKKSWRKILFALAAAAMAVQASAVNYACGGPVNGVTVSPGGVVSAESAGGQHWGYFCQIGATTNTVTSDACKGVLAVLLAAQASGKSVNIWYGDANDCAWHASNGSWAWLTTWYWGPTVSN